MVTGPRAGPEPVVDHGVAPESGKTLIVDARPVVAIRYFQEWQAIFDASRCLSASTSQSRSVASRLREDDALAGTKGEALLDHMFDASIERLLHFSAEAALAKLCRLPCAKLPIEPSRAIRVDLLGY